jgi:hypothetical protein
MAPNRYNGRIIVYCHIYKNAGMMLRYLLRRHFGLKHLDVENRRIPHKRRWYADHRIRARDLRFDLRFYPWVRSLSGHHLRPCVDFEEINDRLMWYTFLRDPLKRYVSHYLWHMRLRKSRGKKILDFSNWICESKFANIQVRWLAGSEDLERAKNILLNTMQFVGFVEHFDISLLLLRERLGVKDFDICYNAPRNIAEAIYKNDLHRSVISNLDRYRDQIMEQNKLDFELYEFAIETIWPSQIQEYGHERLEADLNRVSRHDGSVTQHLRFAFGYIYRNTVYKTVLQFDRWRCKRAIRADGSSTK